MRACALRIIEIAALVVAGIDTCNIVASFRENRREERAEITFTSSDEYFHDARATVALADGSETCATMALAISNEAVAAGDGALQTWRALYPRIMRKSSRSLPLLSNAWARTPALQGTRSADLISGMSCCKLRTKTPFTEGTVHLLHSLPEILTRKSPKTAE